MSNLYIPFPDGRIGYDCRACGSKCCRAGSLRMTPNEHTLVLTQHPQLALFAAGIDAGGRYHDYLKFEPQCWFLRPDGLCHIEQTRGRGAKPLICRSHPVYFQRHSPADIAVLAPGCHWVHTGKPDVGALVSWEDVTALHQEAAHLTPVEPLPRPWFASEFLHTLSAEAAIRDQALHFSEARTYISWQLAYSAHVVSVRRLPDRLSERSLQAAERYLAQLVESSAAFLGTSALEIPPSPMLEQLLLDFIPLLRITLLGKAGPQLRTGSQRFMAAPAMLAMLHLYAKVSGAIGLPQVVDYNGLFAMLSAFRHRLYGASQLLHPLPPAALRKLPQGEPQRLQHLRRLAGANPEQPLHQHLSALCADDSVEERVLLLDAVGAWLSTAASGLTPEQLLEPRD